MKRDPRLHGLSSDHHHALVIARRARGGDLSLDDARQAFAVELAPHFAIEEEHLLPALASSGDAELGALAERTRSEHGELRRALDEGDLERFGRVLTEHVRFEEREVFPMCETRLPAAVLDALAASVASAHRLP